MKIRHLFQSNYFSHMELLHKSRISKKDIILDFSKKGISLCPKSGRSTICHCYVDCKSTGENFFLSFLYSLYVRTYMCIKETVFFVKKDPLGHLEQRNIERKVLDEFWQLFQNNFFCFLFDRYVYILHTVRMERDYLYNVQRKGVDKFYLVFLISM